MRTPICLFLLSTAAFANTCLSVASGNWNDPSKWTTCGGGVPGDGDTAKIAQGQTITIPAGYHAIVGASGAGGLQEQSSGLVAAIGCNGANFHGADGTGILIVNGWLTYRGNVEQCTAVWRVGPDAILEHDSSLASVPGTTNYRWIIGSYLWPDAARLVIRGTVGHRAFIRNAAGSGTFYGFTTYFGSNQGSGQFDFEYTSIDGCGGATPCTDANSHNSGIAYIARCDHCLVTNSGYIGSTIGYPGGVVNVNSFTNSTFTSTTNPAGTAIYSIFRTLGTVTLDTIYTDGALGINGQGDDCPNVHIRNLVIRTNVHTFGISFGGAHFRVGEFDRVLRITDQVGSPGGSTGAYAYLPGGNVTRIMCAINSSSNPHCFTGPWGNPGANDVIDGGYFENLGAGTDGDITGGSNLVGTTTIKNTVTPCSTTTGIAMSLQEVTLPSSRTFALLNNTYCGKDDGAGSARGFGFEVAGTAPVGLLAAARNNIVFCATNVACYLVHQGPTGTDSVGTYQNVDYNWKWNVSTGPYFQMSGTPYTSYNPNPPGAHDSSGDPQFVQQRHFLDWGQMLKPSISTWTDIVAEFAKMNDDTGFDQRFTVLNAYNWLRAGYVPQNAAVYTAGDTGGQVGAMNLIPSRLAGPTKIAGPSVVK
jgi:hypothetical protein